MLRPRKGETPRRCKRPRSRSATRARDHADEASLQKARRPRQPVTLGVAGPEGEPFAGRVWLRKFPHGDVELLYRAGRSPGELERLNVWLEDAGIENRVTKLSPPGYARQLAEDRPQDAESN